MYRYDILAENFDKSRLANASLAKDMEKTCFRK